MGNLILNHDIRIHRNSGKRLKVNTHIDNRKMLFFISYSLYLTYSFLTTTFFYTHFFNEMIYKGLMMLCMFLLVLEQLYFKRLSYKQLLGGILCLGLSLILLRRMMGQFSLLLFFLYIYCCRDIPFDEIAKFSFWILGLLLTGVIICSYLGVIPNYLDTLVIGRERHYLGFTYALNASIIILNIMSLDLFIHRKNPSIFRTILWFVISLWCYFQTRSRLAFAMGIFVLLVTYLTARHLLSFRKMKWIAWGMVTSFINSAVGGILLTVLYDPDVRWMKKCNTILENRLALGKNALSTYGYKLLGIRLQYVGNGLDIFGERKAGEYNYVDCLYISILQKYGILFLIAFIVLLTMTMFYLYKENNYFLMIVMTSIALRGLIDNTFFPLYFNTFWLLIGTEVFGRCSQHKEVIGVGKLMCS